MRICTKCKKGKEEKLFKSIAQYKNTGTCYECKRLMDKISYRKYRVQRLEKCKIYKKNNYEKVVATNRIAVSKKRFGLNRDELITDNSYCLNCGLNQLEHKEKYQRSLNIHHKDGCGRASMRVGQKPNNKTSNLQVLCQACHTSIENRTTKKYIYKDPNKMRKAWETRRRKLLAI